MVKIAHIADCHLRSTQYGSRERGRAFFKGLMSAVKTAVEQEDVRAIICAGDLLDGPYPSAEIIADQLHSLNRYLREQNVPMLVINGNHDNTRVPWGEAFLHYCKEQTTNGIVPLDGVETHYKCFRVCQKGNFNCEATVCGTSFCQPEELRAWLAARKEQGLEADILVWHGEVLEFIGYPKEDCINLSDFPEGMFKVVAMGDQHIHKYIKRESDGLIVAYPGSTEMCSSSEDSKKKMYVYTFENHELKDIKSVPFHTQPVQRFDIHTPEDLEKAYSEMQPGALVYVDYSPTVKGCLPRLKSFIDTHPETFLKARAIAEQKVTAVENQDYGQMQEVPPLHKFAWSTMSDTEKERRVSGMVRDVMDPSCDHREVIDKYCETALESE